MNQGPTGLQPGALPLSYIPNDILLQRQKLHPGHTGNVLPKVVAVRKGIRTPALIRGPEISFLLPIRRQGFHLESGALDHSAILTSCNLWFCNSSSAQGENDKSLFTSHLGIEPRTFGLEVQRAILCANGTWCQDRQSDQEISNGLKMISRAQKVKFLLAERSFDLRTSGLWAQHASTAPLCYG